MKSYITSTARYTSFGGNVQKWMGWKWNNPTNTLYIQTYVAGDYDCTLTVAYSQGKDTARLSCSDGHRNQLTSHFHIYPVFYMTFLRSFVKMKSVCAPLQIFTFSLWADVILMTNLKSISTLIHLALRKEDYSEHSLTLSCRHCMAGGTIRLSLPAVLAVGV